MNGSVKASDISVILPAYNEEATIEQTIKDFHDNLPQAKIWVVNNNSTDNTEYIARKALKETGNDGRLINELRQGKGNALRRAFLEIDAEVYLIADADLTYPANQASELVGQVLNRSADMVIGERHSKGHYQKENKRPFHNFGNRLVRFLVNKLFNAKLLDIMSGYRAFSKAFVKTYPIVVEGFEIETDMTLHALDKRFRIIEIPIDYKDRPEGSFSKLSTFKDGLRVLMTINTILRYYRPMLFFGALSLIFVIGGLFVGLPVVIEWQETGYISLIPSAILATGMEIFGLILLSVGFILDAVIHLERRNFEQNLVDFIKYKKD